MRRSRRGLWKKRAPRLEHPVRYSAAYGDLVQFGTDENGVPVYRHAENRKYDTP